MLALTTALFALSATSASAGTICVPTGTGCDQTSPDLSGAISLAAGTPTDRDTIRLTAGDFTQNAIVGAANPVDIVGVGQGTGGTILRSATATSRSTSSRPAAPCRICGSAWRTRPECSSRPSG